MTFASPEIALARKEALEQVEVHSERRQHSDSDDLEAKRVHVSVEDCNYYEEMFGLRVIPVSAEDYKHVKSLTTSLHVRVTIPSSTRFHAKTC